MANIMKLKSTGLEMADGKTITGSGNLTFTKTTADEDLILNMTSDGCTNINLVADTSNTNEAKTARVTFTQDGGAVDGYVGIYPNENEISLNGSHNILLKVADSTVTSVTSTGLAMESGKNISMSGASTFTSGTGIVQMNGGLKVGSPTTDPAAGNINVQSAIRIGSGANYMYLGEGTINRQGTGTIALQEAVTISGTLVNTGKITANGGILLGNTDRITFYDSNCFIKNATHDLDALQLTGYTTVAIDSDYTGSSYNPYLWPSQGGSLVDNEGVIGATTHCWWYIYGYYLKYDNSCTSFDHVDDLEAIRKVKRDKVKIVPYRGKMVKRLMLDTKTVPWNLEIDEPDFVDEVIKDPKEKKKFKEITEKENEFTTVGDPSSFLLCSLQKMLERQDWLMEKIEMLITENTNLKQRITTLENQDLEQRVIAIENAFASIPLLQNSLEEV